MRQTLLKLRPLLLLTAFLAVYSCQDDEFESNLPDRQEGKSVSRIIRGKEALGLKEMVEAQLAKSQSEKLYAREDDFKVEYEEVYEITDVSGNTHHTFRVVHPNQTASSFYNLVITETSGFKKTVLIEYKMDQGFADKYNIGEADIKNFTGVINFTLVNVESGFPCGPTPNNPIPVSGGSGTGGGGGGGSNGGGNYDGIPGGGGGGGGNGNPYSQELANYKFLQLQIQGTDAEGQIDEGNVGGGAGRDEWILVSRSPRYLNVPELDDSVVLPCGGSEQIGILQPPFNIIISPLFRQMFECQSNVVVDAYSACSDLNNVFLDAFENSDTHHVRYANSSIISQEARTEYVGPPVMNDDGGVAFNFKITFKNSYLETATDLSIAATTIHENLHAILLFFKFSGDIPVAEDNPTYVKLFEAYINKLIEMGNLPSMPGTNNVHHDFMTQFIDDIAATIKAYGESKGYTLPDEYYNALAWQGLTHIQNANGTNVINPAFVALVPSESERNRIREIITVEKTNEPREGITPTVKSNSCNH